MNHLRLTHPLVWSFSFLLGLTHPAWANDPNWVNEQLAKFQANPKEYFNDPNSVFKIDPETLEPIVPTELFSRKSIESGQYIHEKAKQKMKDPSFRAHLGRAAVQANDRPEMVVDRLEVSTLEQMEESALTSSQLREQPWSDYYWATAKGGLGFRYSDASYPTEFSEIEPYLLRSISSIPPELMSPSEKYDLLVGDTSKTLTRSILRDGARYLKPDGSIEPWMGICHGWAPASYMLPRPKKTIELLSADGVSRVTFYPTDIKALASLLWANAAPKTRFIGGRCRQIDPPTDPFSGRVLAPDCFDTNPATWHLALVNQLGVSKRSLIMDATYDYEVWNQPIQEYHYTYFNPTTRIAVKTLKEARVPIREFSNDVYRAYRNPKARYVVGIVMKVVYIGETLPKASLADSPAQDSRVAVRYFYDLELDESLNIVGGEWYNKQHPDFLWTPGPEARAIARGDLILSNDPSTPQWNMREALPLAWSRAARQSSFYRQPLASIVQGLIEMSRK